ncbi:MAG: transposase, partial [Raoultibacter sp.]
MPEAFGGTGAGAKAPTAQASFLYDPLNDIIVDAKLAPLSTDERTLAKEHLMALSRLTSIKKKLILFDHGYPSSDLIAALQASHCDFLFRVRSKFSIALDALDMGVDPFDFPCDDGSTIPLVAVKLTLDSGETELLLTSIGEAQEIIDDSSDDTSKYCYKANVNHAIGVYKDAFIAVVLEPDSVKFIWRLCKIVQ